MNVQATLIPLKPAIAKGQQQINVLLKIEPRLPAVKKERPAFNLSFVIDRSGSMSGYPLQQVKDAVAYAINALEERDVISVVDFGADVHLCLPATPVMDKTRLLQAVASIRSNGNTALYDGWLEGATQVAALLDPQRINRVVLLSDGMANRGLTDRAQISQNVAGMAERGVTTTTMGVSRDYNEDLLTSMADAGRANYYFIERPEEIPAFFQRELFDLEATVGQLVRLHAPEVRLEPYNKLGMDNSEFVLPDLVGGVYGYFLFKLHFGQAAKATVYLRYQTPEGEEQIELHLDLPQVDQGTWDAMPAHPEVEIEQVRYQATGLRANAMELIKINHLSEAQEILQQTSALLSRFPQLVEERQKLDRALGMLHYDSSTSRKNLSRQIHTSGKGDRRQ